MTQTRTTQPARAGFGSFGGRTHIEDADNTRQTLRRLLTYLRPYGFGLTISASLILLTTALNLAGPILLGRAIDRYVVPGDLDGLWGTVLTILAVYVSSGLAAFIQWYLMVGIGHSLVADIRAQLFEHVQGLSMAYHDQNPAGDLMSRVSNDTESISRTLSNGLIDFATNGLLLIGILIAMFVLNWQLALGAATILPFMLWLTTKITQLTRRAFRQVQKHLGTLNAVMEENITGIRVVQSFAQEGRALSEFSEVNSAYRKVGTRADLISAALGPIFSTMNVISIGFTSLLGGWLALRGVVEVGVLATFVIYVMNFFRPMRSMAMLYNQLQSAVAGAERIFAVLDVTPTIQDQPDAILLDDIDGRVSFEGVHFSYEEDKPVLIDVSLEAIPGETVALVGPTGAGKTTVISLLSRFYDVTEGGITIDGHDIRNVTQASLRESLGIVLQDSFLFTGTVMENIRYGRLGASDDEVIEAARLANADWFIRRLPQGYQTNVSEQGNNFSQGQRQLVAIARAVLADPQILILDEATSSVDTRTEIQIQEALLRLMEGRTAFVIAHRLSTIRNADQVLVVNENRIIERGTHEELLGMEGFYWNLFMSQYARVS